MFCISSPNCRVFAHVVHTLGKIGDDILFEPRANSLVLKTKNMAESSYAEIEFHANFFSTFSFNAALYEDNATNFKIQMRSLVSVVKSPHSFDKNVETCLLRCEQRKPELMVTINYSKGTTKEYIIPHLEYESFEANFSKSDANNYILSDACTLISATNQFKSGEDEITLSSGKENSVLENHLQNAKDCKTTVKTTVRVDHQYLETYSISFPTQITFCLKEFKALLALSESVRLPIAFYFDTPGKPLILEVGEPNVFRINVLISTLQTVQSNQQQTSQNLPQSSATPYGAQSVESNTVTKNMLNVPKNSARNSNQNSAESSDSNSDERRTDSQFATSKDIPSRSQRGSQNAQNKDNRTQNQNISVTNGKNMNSEPHSQNDLLRQAQNDLEGLGVNDFLGAENDFPSSYQNDHEPVPSNSTMGKTSAPRAELSQIRRDYLDTNTHDVDEFVVNGGLVEDSDGHSSRHISNGILRSRESYCSGSQQVYLTIFRQCFSSSDSRRKEKRPKILVYSSDGVSDSD